MPQITPYGLRLGLDQTMYRRRPSSNRHQPPSNSGGECEMRQHLPGAKHEPYFWPLVVSSRGSVRLGFSPDYRVKPGRYVEVTIPDRYPDAHGRTVDEYLAFKQVKAELLELIYGIRALIITGADLDVLERWPELLDGWLIELDERPPLLALTPGLTGRLHPDDAETIRLHSDAECVPA